MSAEREYSEVRLTASTKALRAWVSKSETMWDDDEFTLDRVPIRLPKRK